MILLIVESLLQPTVVNQRTFEVYQFIEKGGVRSGLKRLMVIVLVQAEVAWSGGGRDEEPILVSGLNKLEALERRSSDKSWA